MAVMVMDKTVTFSSAHDKARLKDPATLREREKVKLIADEQLERLMPLRVTFAEVQLTEGGQLTRRVDSVRGTPNNPRTGEALGAQSRDVLAPSLGPAQWSDRSPR